MQNRKPTHLSDQAVEEFRQLYEQEFGETLSDEEAARSAESLLRFFDILRKQPSSAAQPLRVAEEEWKALRYIHDALFHQKRQPTVRSIAAAIGRSSSRVVMQFLIRDRD